MSSDTLYIGKDIYVYILLSWFLYEHNISDCYMHFCLTMSIYELKVTRLDSQLILLHFIISLFNTNI